MWFSGVTLTGRWLFKEAFYLTAADIGKCHLICDAQKESLEASRLLQPLCYHRIYDMFNPHKENTLQKTFNTQNRSGDQFTSRWTIFLHMMTHSQTAEKTARVKVTNRCEEHPGLPILLFLYLRARKKHFSPQPWCFTETPISHNHFVPNSSFGLTSPPFLQLGLKRSETQTQCSCVTVVLSFFFFFFVCPYLSVWAQALLRKKITKARRGKRKGQKSQENKQCDAAGGGRTGQIVQGNLDGENMKRLW